VFNKQQQQQQQWKHHHKIVCFVFVCAIESKKKIQIARQEEKEIINKN
jgi:hypothetical protein